MGDLMKYVDKKFIVSGVIVAIIVAVLVMVLRRVQNDKAAELANTLG